MEESRTLIIGDFITADKARDAISARTTDGEILVADAVAAVRAAIVQNGGNFTAEQVQEWLENEGVLFKGTIPHLAKPDDTIGLFWASPSSRPLP